MLSTLITEQARKQECNTICTIARNNGFPLQTIQNLKNKWTIKTQKNRKYSHKNTKKEVDYICVLQSTHTQSYQPVQKYRLKRSIEHLISYTTNYAIEHHKTNLTLVDYINYNAKHVANRMLARLED